ncbi:MAG: Gfo/Idh/MocA family oxidoreductase [Bryobacteraceae bacterium]|nr:Gfo/Idh/MocA family oxidoreductase [Bryobacteraceae bacterium]
MTQIRTAVIGAGAFGRNHLRVVRESPLATLAGVLDSNPERAAAAAAQFECPAFKNLLELAERADAAIVATPTTSHAEIGCRLMELGLDVLIEKPIAADLGSAAQLVETAGKYERILAVGHLERFNPAVQALEKALSTPLFFEVHRLSEFSPRSLDVDVVLDLMIHDLEIVIAMAGKMPEEVRAAGISILSPKVDLANVRLAFPGGAIANLTASRVSTERVRKLRIFQPGQYLSIDYARQDGVVFSVSSTDGATRQIGFAPLSVQKDEPLRLELEDFFLAVRDRRPPRVDGIGASRALQVASEILDKIEEHSRIVARTLARG